MMDLNASLPLGVSSYTLPFLALFSVTSLFITSQSSALLIVLSGRFVSLAISPKLIKPFSAVPIDFITNFVSSSVPYASILMSPEEFSSWISFNSFLCEIKANKKNATAKIVARIPQRLNLRLNAAPATTEHILAIIVYFVLMNFSLAFVLG